MPRRPPLRSTASLPAALCAATSLSIGLAACDGSAAPLPLPALKPGELSVLTYNVYGHPLLAPLQRPARFGQIAQELSAWLAGVHIIALQEAHVPRAAALREARAEGVFGACGETGAFNPTGLLSLSDHPLTAAPERLAFVHGAGGVWRLVSQEALDCTALAGAQRTLKGALFVTVAAPAGEVDVLNVHLATNPEDRAAQKALLEGWLANRAPGRPLLVLGDLNEDACRAGGFLAGLTEASCGVGPTVGGLRWGIAQGALFGGQLDHVFAEGAKPTDKRRRVFARPRRGGYLSDHDGVYAVVQLPASPARKTERALRSREAPKPP